VTTSEFSFDRFASQPFYRAVNARLVEIAQLEPGQRIVDLACGPGSVTKLILDRVRGAREGVVIGIDRSASALRQARVDLTEAGAGLVQFLEGRAEDLSELVREKVDRVVFCNAIHLVEDKDLVVEEVARSLKPGGVFAFNTAFFQGTQTRETEQFYRRWMLRALRTLKGTYGITPSRGAKTMARQTWTKQEYEALVERHGFCVATSELLPVDVPLEGWQDISSFEDFITGALPGVPLDKASQVLRETVVQVGQ
jgi:ubiquinone/menaquinone biosynthesis C-methylase UbiE